MKPICLLLALAAILPHSGAAEAIIPKISALDGSTYAEVKVIKREGDGVRIMHAGGIKTLKFSELDRASAVALGIEEFEKESAAKEIAEARKVENEKRESAAQADAKSRYLDAARRKKTKDVIDWAALALAGGGLDLATMKSLIGRPPDYQIGDSYFWRNACWNAETEKPDELTLTTTRLIRTVKGEPVIFGGKILMDDAPTLKSGSHRYVSSPDTDATFETIMVEQGKSLPDPPK